MATCIYDDSPSVTICPGCDFGVCQACVDTGSEGVCRTCSEERAHRRESSAIQRAYDAPVVQARRCNYCRAPEDETLTLDGDGYCEACRDLPRCVAHSDLVAVGNCKSCRREYCRKCLGFTDVCQSCQTRQKTRPLTDRGGAAAGGAKPGPKKARKTSPIDSQPPAARKGDREEAPAAARPAGKPGKKRSRGQVAIEEKLRAQQEAKQSRTRNLVLASVAALLLLMMSGGAYLHAMSPEAQAAKIHEQMVTVHRAVVHHYRKTNKLPQSVPEIRAALADLHVKGARRIKIAMEGDSRTGAVIYVPSRTGSGFMIQGANSRGELLMAPNDAPLFLDQYYESGGQAP
ncbi:MAG: hypothetical protein VKQ33_06160 [Candidatus Sericytochromatia bacterium]|nr:hypothetical protein [Candidatus Sericytochromatia bacterium]